MNLWVDNVQSTLYTTVTSNSATVVSTCTWIIYYHLNQSVAAWIKLAWAWAWTWATFTATKNVYAQWKPCENFELFETNVSGTKHIIGIMMTLSQTSSCDLCLDMVFNKFAAQVNVSDTCGHCQIIWMTKIVSLSVMTDSTSDARDFYQSHWA